MILKRRPRACLQRQRTCSPAMPASYRLDRERNLNNNYQGCNNSSFVPRHAAMASSIWLTRFLSCLRCARLFIGFRMLADKAYGGWLGGWQVPDSKQPGMICSANLWSSIHRSTWNNRHYINRIYFTCTYLIMSCQT